jgi:hypothetical protein
VSASENDVRKIWDRIGSIIGKIAGGSVGTIANLATGSPFAGVLLTAFSSEQFDRLSKELINKHLAPKQERRLALAMWHATNYLDQQICAGAKLRTDDFVQGREGEPSAAEEIIEGALRASMNSFEQAKARHLGMLAANVCLERFSHIDPATAVVALDIAERLSYRGFLLLKILKHIETLELSERPQSDGRKMTPRVSALLVELYSLYQLSLAGMAGEDNSWLAAFEAASMSPKNMRLGSLGIILHDLLGLDTIDSAAQPLRATVEAMMDASETEASTTVVDRKSVPPLSIMQGSSAP